jgi:hypothetical protein
MPEPGNADRGMNVMDCFKLYLDPVFLRNTFGNNSEHAIWVDEDVQMWFTDFLTALRKHIIKHISEELEEPGLGDWKSNTVEYIFSVPTSWNEPKVVETFKEIVAKAGFGEEKDSSMKTMAGAREEKGHSVKIGLTEAEAAAVYTARSSKHRRPISSSGRGVGSVPEPPIKGSRVQEGHTLLICDSGGGTTVSASV